MLEGLHAHLDPVVLPDGTTVTATSYLSGYRRQRLPDYGLYLDTRWTPPWPYAHLDWPDMGVSSDPTLRASFQDLLERAREGHKVEVGCLGGHGRTGTALGCLAVLTGARPDEAVAWVRQSYCSMAVETPAQEDFVRRFA